MDGDHFRDRFLVAAGEVPGDGDFAFALAVEDAPVALRELSFVFLKNNLQVVKDKYNFKVVFVNLGGATIRKERDQLSRKMLKCLFAG